MCRLLFKGCLYESVDFRELQEDMKNAIEYLQRAKSSITDKNQLRAIKACQNKIRKTYYKIKGIESSRYSAKFRPLTDEERLRNLKGIDARLEKAPQPQANQSAELRN